MVFAFMKFGYTFSDLLNDKYIAQFQNAHVTFSFQHFHLNPNTLCNANIEIWPIIMNVHLMNCTALIDNIFYADFQLERNLIQTRIGP